MPEGDTIHRTAANLRKALDGAVILQCTGRDAEFAQNTLANSSVVGIEARGKHLMIHLDDDRVLHSHMGMTGSWHIYRPDDEWHKPSNQAVVALHTERWCVVCFTPKLIQLLSARQLQRDAWLQKLGPDILGPPIDDRVVLNRFRTQNSVAIGEVLMNQTVLSGIGNIYKSEILFMEQLHPLRRVDTLSDGQILLLRDRALSLMKRNLQKPARQTRFRSDAPRLWVYGRSGQPCLLCGRNIEMLRQGTLARSTCFCPACQPADQ
ncbi:MAG: DNA-formamidopyrimidine glycosylase family protein [Fuerstiella sp.]